jgi:CBS domain-containing protein
MDTPTILPDIERALQAVGALLASRGERVGIVVLGGAALNLLGVVDRATRDVDVVALARGGRRSRLERPDPLPPALASAVARVARDLALSPDWLNAVAGSQWDTGLPRGLRGRLHWRRYGGLDVGIVDRRDLVFFKLYASADATGPASVHVQDLLALRPTDEELRAAARWVRTQDPSPAIATAVEKVLAYVRSVRG